ncbi:MAG: tetratricopeptide repeat protein [Leptolyngbya sp. PLA1]|nr:tetratricopeptide repeat protein [Leptolyngbya sp. PLA1]
MPTDTHPWIDAEAIDSVAEQLALAPVVHAEAERALLALAIRAAEVANSGQPDEARRMLEPVCEGSATSAVLFLCFQLWFRTAVAPGTLATERAERLRVAGRVATRRIMLAERAVGSRDLGRAHTNLALVRHYQGPDHHAEAERHYLRAIECDAAIGHQPGLARDIGNLGNFYEETGRPDEAEPLYLRALSLARAHGLRKVAAGQLANLGDVAHGRGEFARAAECWREAMEIFRTLGENNQATELSRKLRQNDAGEPAATPP